MVANGFVAAALDSSLSLGMTEQEEVNCVILSTEKLKLSENIFVFLEQDAVK
jgi:hypothetical protein